MKSFDDPSFLPRLFPAGDADGASTEAAGKHTTEPDVSCDFSVLEKVVDGLPVSSEAGGGRSDTSRLQKAFRELASHVCRLLVAHDSELLIEGTVGVTVDGGARVMLLHFADQVRKTESSSTARRNIPNSASEPTAVGSIIHDVTAGSDVDKDGTVNKPQASVHCSEETAFADGDAELPSSATQSSQYGSASAKILSELAQQTASMLYANSRSDSDAVASPARGRKSELDGSCVGDKPKPQTLLRELLCAPLPAKRLCRPVNPAPAATAAGLVGEVGRPRRPTANSTVLGGLLRTGTYKRDLNYSVVGNAFGRDALPKYEAGVTGTVGSQCVGIDVQGPQFGGNAVQALLKLASEHAAGGRHDLLRANRRRESAATPAEGFVNDGLADASADQRFSTQRLNLSGTDLHGTNSEFISAGQNFARSDSYTTYSGSSELRPLTVKQETVDPSYDQHTIMQ